MISYTVYIQMDNDNNVIGITSDDLPIGDAWIAIDKGYGSKYTFASNYYLKKSLIDKNGLYNYKYINNTVVERTNEEKQPELDKINYRNEIIELKNKLSATDYIAVKLAEGVATKEEYTDELTDRANWRARINELESLI